MKFKIHIGFVFGTWLGLVTLFISRLVVGDSSWAHVITKLQVANIISSVGFPPPVVPIMTCISHHESSFRTSVLNYNRNNTIDYGFMQVNTIWLQRCRDTAETILDVYNNARCAFLVYQTQGLTAWVTFNKFSAECLNYKVPGFKLPNYEKYYTVYGKSEPL